MRITINFKTILKSVKVLVALLVMLFTLSQSIYGARMDKSGMFDNTFKTALPQTAVAELVNDHFDASLPAGKTVKKCFIFGYDGARCDGLFNIKGMENSAINDVAASGGLYVSYAGGPDKVLNAQATSTGPGWASILTGKWAKDTGVKNNGQLLNSDCRTVLTSLVESGKADSAAFMCIWDGHITGENATYREEARYTRENDIPVRWETYSWDDTLHQALLIEAASTNCADIVFFVYERPDSAGHGKGFSNDVPEYVEAIKGCDRDAYDLITTIKARPSYAQEDWLFVITSDHGGHGTGHGTQHVDCRMTYIATNKAIAVD